MFQEEARVGSVEAELVVAVSSLDMFRPVQRLAEISADKVFVADFSAESRGSSRPFEVVVEVCAVDICLVIVERIGFRIVAEEFKTVVGMVPVQGRAYREPSLDVMGLYGGKTLEGVLELLVVSGRVEAVGTPVLVAHSGIPVHLDVIIPELSLVESLQGLVVAVKMPFPASGIAVATGIGRGKGVLEGSASWIFPQAGKVIFRTHAQIAVRSGFSIDQKAVYV